MKGTLPIPTMDFILSRLLTQLNIKYQEKDSVCVRERGGERGREREREHGYKAGFP